MKKYKHINRNESTHNKMKWAQCDKSPKPNPENCKNCSSKCAYDSAQLRTQYNTEQSDNLPSYLQTTIIARMLSVGGLPPSLAF